MTPIKILGIAPYHGMESLMQHAAKKRDDVQLTAYVGDLLDGVQIAKRLSCSDFDIILSRGGTAELIRKETELPVVDICISVHDILRSIKLAENHSCKYAIIGFPAITENAQFLCDVLRYDIDIATIHNQTEARNTLQQLESQGCKMVLCDVVTHSLAQECGMPAMLITSGLESVDAALELAVQNCVTMRALNTQAQFYRSVLESLPQDIFVYKEDGTLCYASHRNTPPEILQNKLILDDRRTETQKKLIEGQLGQLHHLHIAHLEISGDTRSVVSVSTQRAPCPLEKHGIRFFSRQDVSDPFFNSFYGTIQPFPTSNLTLEQYAQSAQPIVVFGEKGTGKDQMAHLLYTKGLYAANPLIEIDCARLNTKGWKFLMENDTSPLNDNQCTLYFKQMSALSEHQLKELCSTLKALQVEKRNKLLFSANCTSNGDATPPVRSLSDKLFCLSLFMTPLRKCLQEMPSLTSLYISTLNMSTAKAVIGFEDGAPEMMQNYSWPGNYDQFKRILSGLVLMTDTAYISLEHTQKLLKREQLLSGCVPDSACSLDLTQPLETITSEILQRVLTQENGNQSKAARSLGISRTTLWRMLQKDTLRIAPIDSAAYTP